MARRTKPTPAQAIRTLARNMRKQLGDPEAIVHCDNHWNTWEVIVALEELAEEYSTASLPIKPYK